MDNDSLMGKKWKSGQMNKWQCKNLKNDNQRVSEWQWQNELMTMKGWINDNERMNKW